MNLASIATVPPMTSNFDYTAGADLGGSYHKSVLEAWEGEDSEYEDFQFTSEDNYPESGEKFLWRFNNSNCWVQRQEGTIVLIGFNNGDF